MQNAQVKRVAFLWDESFLWGVMAYKALRAAGLPFELVRAEDVRNGCLDRFSALFVPGGWASNKIKALGNGGVEAIKRFVHEGGSYMGFCGGAGLATQDGIGLLPVKRRPTKDRVPSFSGPIQLDLKNHALWQGIKEPIFHAWWPSQFVADEGVTVLATYGEALPDAFSSDVNVGDAENSGLWPQLEQTYGINLDPRRLLNEPAVLEGRYGSGRVLLSLVHFDSPDDRSGVVVLKNLWRYLVASEQNETPNGKRSASVPDKRTCEQEEVVSVDIFVQELNSSVNELISLGQRNFLWFWRNPMLLQWRRGVRGLEYCTLSVMMREIAELLQHGCAAGMPVVSDRLENVRNSLLPFVEQAKQLLVKERFALQESHITYERCNDPEMQVLREKLFSKSKSHGGMFKEIIDRLDTVLFSQLTGC